MSATSRRKFLSGAAAAGAGVACASISPAAAAAVLRAPTHDEMVAIDFINWPRHQESPAGRTRLACLVYGLVCVDALNQEALLPNSAGVPNVRPHQARLWTTTSSIVGANPFSGSETGTDSTGVLTFFSIATYKVQITPLTALGAPAPDVTPQVLKWRNSLQHPWQHEKWVRSLKVQTGKEMIPLADRENRALVTSRVQMKGGRVTAVPPFTLQGQHAEWRSTVGDGTIRTAATTDSMLWTRNYHRTTDRLAITFTNSTGVKTLYLKMAPGGLKAAITHATDTASSDPTKMTDSTAFARLLVGNAPSSFPVPELATLPHPSALGSSQDVHCEGGRP